MSDIHVSDHAVLRYLERVVGLDIDSLRSEIAATCARSQGAPCVRTKVARYLVRGRYVVTVLNGRTVPHFDVLADIVRRNEGLE
ncbi:MULTISPECIES: hypothetical protein [unclassified Mesorhizobium]|uniref:hypothetical protein n=1 Tax=unclassified Mesorhizobium TaxID=325217 RepID=UPI000AE785D1|nr:MULTISPECIES: hypothetical protein [unclassified Mesorhizobium]